MSDETIQVFRPSMGEEEIESVAEVIRSGWIGLGPRTREFEERFAEYVGAAHAVALNSATAALHLSCVVAGVGPGDEVLVPAITFVSTAHAAAYCGAVPVFVDVEPDTLNMDPEDLLRKVTPRSKAVVPVHYGGHACRMDEIWDIAEERGLAVIEDAAHACGSEYRGKRVGGLERSALTCFSFHAVKNLATGDGGMITTNSSELANTLRRLRWLGIDKSTWDRTETAARPAETPGSTYGRYGWYYEVREVGFKCHMNDLTAAIGLVQLAKLERANGRRRELAAAYNRELGGLCWLECPVERDYTSSAWHNYVIRTPHRDNLNLWLKEKGVASGVHYMPLHLQPCYAQSRGTTLPVTEEVWPQLLTLPLYPDLTDEQQNRVAGSVLDFEPQR